MKLISLNVEGKKHTETVFSFLHAEAADVVCLQETPEDWCTQLQKWGYCTTFAPMLIRNRNEEPNYTEGILFASKEPHQTTTQYYHRSNQDIVEYKKEDRNKRDTIAHPIILGSVTIEDNSFCIATTHLMVTKDGKADDHQRQGVKKLLAILANKEPHILCGDFNMPRSVNELYEQVTHTYTDVVPAHFSSSLDRNIHRLGNSATLDQPIFDSYLVDYIFTQPPYQASNVHLQFGISDHAAVVGEIHTQ